LGEADEKCLDTWAARDKGEEKEEGERGAVEVGGASVADVRQTRREAVEVALPSRAKGGQVIGCDENVNAFNSSNVFLYFSISDTELETVPSIPPVDGYICDCVVLPLVSGVCMKKKFKNHGSSEIRHVYDLPESN
jgi:hypothetical protein